MFFDRLDGDRFFARLWGIDLECPSCGRIHIIDTRTHHNKIRERVPMFTCSNDGCQFKMLLGVIGWEPNMGPTTIPPDTVPTGKQAWALGELLAGRHTRTKTSHDAGRKRQVNVVLRKGCLCQLVMIAGRWRKPLNAACPVCVDEQVDVPATATPAKLMAAAAPRKSRPRNLDKNPRDTDDGS